MQSACDARPSEAQAAALSHCCHDVGEAEVEPFGVLAKARRKPDDYFSRRERVDEHRFSAKQVCPQRSRADRLRTSAAIDLLGFGFRRQRQIGGLWRAVHALHPFAAPQESGFRSGSYQDTATRIRRTAA